MANQADFPIRALCRTLGVSSSGYHAWIARPTSRRTQENAMMTERIRAIHVRSGTSYGEPRIRAELRDQGVIVNHKRLARLMQMAGLRGISRRRSYIVTTRHDKKHQAAKDLVRRQFVANAPNLLWVADITYVPTWAGFIYLAIVLDVWSRRIVGWAIGEHMPAELVIAALDMAIEQRRPVDVIHHSDKGSQYTSLAFGQRCQTMGIRPSTGSVGDAYDNAMAESFFASLECELINTRSFKTKIEARLAVFTWIEAWYNPYRRHSAIGYQSPVNFERNNTQKNHFTDTELPTADLCVACATSAVDNLLHNDAYTVSQRNT
jgi:putative transposase